MPKLFVNGKETEFENGMTVLQACELAGEEIPRFCYHERLAIAGNCRMCLVQIEGGPPKPAASCAMPATEGMAVHTNTPMVKKAREGVMEFLLMNHPLDCPICDQGGECDLQDQAMAYGKGLSRFTENKRAVKEKYMGPLIKTYMTRCIHCTRCMRFITDIAGIEELGAIGRGEHMEITTYIEKSLTSELSGNIIDLCPVGALTSKPYAFKARSWELVKTETIDVMDAVGSNIRVDSRGREVMRVLPRLHEDINEEWLSDKGRFAYDGLRIQRLDRPYIRINGKLQEASFEEAFATIAEKLAKVQGSEIAAIAGDMADCESMFLLKKLLTKLNCENFDCRQDGVRASDTVRCSYLFNSSIAGIENADAILLIGTNPRIEAPILNARIRKAYLNNNTKIALIGEEVDLSYPANYLGNDSSILSDILSGKNDFAKILEQAQRPAIILGTSALTGNDADDILGTARAIAEKYGCIKDNFNGFNVLQTAASRVGGLDLGFVPSERGKATKGILQGCKNGGIKVLYLLGADELDFEGLEDVFVIYQGHHGDKGAHIADVILPGAAYTEKEATYVNLEGRVQRTQIAVYPPGQAREDWKIIAALLDKLGISINFASLSELRKTMAREVATFAEIDIVKAAKWQNFGKKGSIKSRKFVNKIKNFYMTDPISRASKTMAKCSNEILGLNSTQNDKATAEEAA